MRLFYPICNNVPNMQQFFEEFVFVNTENAMLKLTSNALLVTPPNRIFHQRHPLYSF